MRSGQRIIPRRRAFDNGQRFTGSPLLKIVFGAIKAI
jgi:hypothetical protein